MDLFCTFTALSGVKLCALMHMYRQKPKNAMLVGKVADINLYPIKSCRALELQSANCTHAALQHPQIPDLLDRLVVKADRPHPRDYPHTSTDYRHTDNHLRLVFPIPRGVTPHVNRRGAKKTNSQTYPQTDRRYQAHHLPVSIKLRG